MVTSLYNTLTDLQCGRKSQRDVLQATWGEWIEQQTGKVVYIVSPLGSIDVVQRLTLEHRLSVHNGCVNSIFWNETGDYILSGSDDQHICITNPYTGKVKATIHSGHRANIFCAKFLPKTCDKKIVSCSGDGMIYFTDLEDVEPAHPYNSFDCHFGTVYEVLTVPSDPNTFLSCGEDGTIRWFDLRTKTRCAKQDCKEDILINCRRAVTSLAINPQFPWQLAAGCSDSSVRVYDRRMLGTRATGNYNANNSTGMLLRFCAPDLGDRAHRITSLCYSADAAELLVSYSSQPVCLFNLRDERQVKLDASASSMTSPDACGSDPGSDAGDKKFAVKRLRLRGDWSDTGPDARPEHERESTQEPGERTAQTIMQRMSDIMTRWIQGAVRPDGDTPEGAAAEDASSAAETPQVAGSTDPEETTSREGQGHGTEEARPSLAPLEELPDDVTAGSDVTAPPAAAARPKVPELEALRQSMDDVTAAGGGVGPVINLQYSSQSTSAAHIKVDFETLTSPDPGDVTESLPPPRAASGTPPTSVTSQDTPASETPRVAQTDNNSEQITQDASAIVAETSQDAPAGEANPDGATQPRRRRVGHSLPPTGDFQLFSDQDSDSDSDMELMRAAGASRRSRREPSDIARNMAAMRLQELYRKRQEQREWENQVLKNTHTPAVTQMYRGHRNARTMIKEACFWGDRYVISGSDCGHVFIWERQGGRLVNLLEGDKHVVNCVQPHPFHPVLATSGIDYDIKIWSPLAEEASFDRERADKIVTRNEVMLRETRDTITVPASFMLRMLASLNHIRTGRGTSQSTHDSTGQADSSGED